MIKSIKTRFFENECFEMFFFDHSLFANVRNLQKRMLRKNVKKFKLNENDKITQKSITWFSKKKIFIYEKNKCLFDIIANKHKQYITLSIKYNVLFLLRISSWSQIFEIIINMIDFFFFMLCIFKTYFQISNKNEFVWSFV